MENTMYSFRIVGEAVSPFRGGIPEDQDQLVKKPKKPIATQLYNIMKTRIEIALKERDIDTAIEALEWYLTEKGEYLNPLLQFRRDKQNGNRIYMGAHCFLGALRDSAQHIFAEHFYKKEQGRTDKPSAKHFRKFVQVTPYHVFFHRPKWTSKGGNIIKTFDKVEDQQPSPSVGAFSRYETIYPPFQFLMRVNVSYRGPFAKLLEDPDNMKDIIFQAVSPGLMSGRSAGYGMWKLIECEVETP